MTGETFKSSIIVYAKILKWGNSYGIRITKAQAKRLGLGPGDEVVVEVKARPDEEIDVSHLRSFSMGGLAREHDEGEWA